MRFNQIHYEINFVLSQVAAIQISPSQLTIENFATDYCHDLKTDIHIKGVYMLKVRSTSIVIKSATGLISGSLQNTTYM